MGLILCVEGLECIFSKEDSSPMVTASKVLVFRLVYLQYLYICVSLNASKPLSFASLFLVRMVLEEFGKSPHFVPKRTRWSHKYLIGMAFLSHKVSLTNCGWWDTRRANSAFARGSPRVVLSIDCEVAPPENWGAYTLQKLINTIAIV